MSGYRLGDCILWNKLMPGYATQKEMSNTIGGQYLAATSECNDIKTLVNIMRKNNIILDMQDECVVHLRLGDVMQRKLPVFLAFLDNHAMRRPPSVRVLVDIINKTVPKHQHKIIIHGNHTGTHKKESDVYLKKVKKYLTNASITSNPNADEDFARMVNARTFIRGRGGFSDIVEKVRTYLGRPTIVNIHICGYVVWGVYFQYHPFKNGIVQVLIALIIFILCVVMFVCFKCLNLQNFPTMSLTKNNQK
jgi:hypothetical protein